MNRSRRRQQRRYKFVHQLRVLWEILQPSLSELASLDSGAKGDKNDDYLSSSHVSNQSSTTPNRTTSITQNLSGTIYLSYDAMMQVDSLPLTPYQHIVQNNYNNTQKSQFLSHS